MQAKEFRKLVSDEEVTDMFDSPVAPASYWERIESGAHYDGDIKSHWRALYEFAASWLERNRWLPRAIPLELLREYKVLIEPLFSTSLDKQPPPDWVWRRYCVLERDNWTCQNCGIRSKRFPRHLHAHHKKQKAAGGSHELCNLEVLCCLCHESKPNHEGLTHCQFCDSRFDETFDDHISPAEPEEIHNDPFLGLNFRRNESGTYDPRWIIYYNDEKYLLDLVRTRFRRTGRLSPADFLTILIWKAERAKTRHIRRLKQLAPTGRFDDAVKLIAAGLYTTMDPKGKLCLLMTNWQFYLPTATAILSLLYPEEFTVYDWRVREAIGFVDDLSGRNFGDGVWLLYQSYVASVRSACPEALGLRDCDQMLLGRSVRLSILEECRLADA